MENLIAVRTNTRFVLDYETQQLKPSVEVIIIVAYPQYVRKGKELVKTIEYKELRFETATVGVNELIGQLQATTVMLNTYEQMSAAFNQIIKSATKEEGKQ